MSVFKKGTKAYGIFAMKCPRCHEGDLFETKSLSFEKPFKMYDRCPKCDQSYMPEPGFYFGSMFISYIIWGWMSLAIVGALIWGLGWGVNASFIVLLIISAILFVPLFRFSRSLWININVKYDALKAKLVELENENL